ncbi:LLM class F420-dependent oxidoreductase [Rhizocola hellebori]|uniref:LLM class F420-dependent oxidoreductase n=1 Tax=Rhizocola hellebori TaxID=1392758 RepID=A0A8J3Q506_9ACTN|nr:TIGR03621 family F420-dependent LLM class oxidoreductase [Rhizocola hellebori]GIH03945.1 LLM class F420-dependent oxidoreductase [Rhizocola hellebori]
MRPFRFFGLAAAGPVGIGEIAETARRAEAAGFTGLVLPDHLLKQHAPIPVLATVAAVTQQLRIMPFVLNAALRHPAVLAQDLASLDVLSGGRLEVGIGAGWNRLEHEAVGIPFEPAARRVDRLAEAVDVLKGCFGPDPFSYQGKFYALDHHDGYPKPVQQPHPPLFIGGGARRLLTLAARHADTVGLAPRVLPGGNGVPAPDPGSLTLAAAQEKVAWIRAAAGERFESLELNLYPSGGPLVVTAKAAEPAQQHVDNLRRVTGVELTTADVLQSPHVFIGTVAELVDKIRSLRALLGVSSFMLGEVDAAIPIVEQLAGQ